MRCCANDSGTVSAVARGRAVSRVLASVPVCDSTRAASASTVDASNSVRTGTVVPSAAPIRETTRVAISELPPRSKKSSSTPTRGRSSTSANTAATVSCTGVTGARKARACTAGAGSARRSSLPLTVSGIHSSRTTAEGTMYAGSSSAAPSRTWSRFGAVSGSDTTYATIRWSPGWSSRTMTAAWAIPGWASTADSISPSSMRKPRTFT
ncbi:hypothetical protein FMUBM48_48890 [Nocardia cyriacigeorgica]|nr:hypothetical protein FMUBM48_48890 [Nocardia cyriacigeorgica]